MAEIDINNPVNQEFYAYSVSFADLAAGTSAIGTITIEADSYFKAQKLTYFADIAAASQSESSRVIPLITLTITDTGSGRQLMNNAIPVPALFGIGELPFILPTPKVFKPRSAVQFTASNYNAAATYNLYVVISGSKLWF